MLLSPWDFQHCQKKKWRCPTKQVNTMLQEHPNLIKNALEMNTSFESWAKESFESAKKDAWREQDTESARGKSEPGQTNGEAEGAHRQDTAAAPRSNTPAIQSAEPLPEGKQPLPPGPKDSPAQAILSPEEKGKPDAQS